MLRTTRNEILLALGLLAAPLASAEVLVRLETGLGDVVIAMDDDRAPLTTEYFLEYIDSGKYDGATLYRSASFDENPDPQIVQGGIMFEALNAEGTIDPASFGVEYLTALESTSDTGLAHTRGAVSFARDLLYTGHVIPEIVFCLRDVPAMDANGRDKPDTRGFPVAGHVVSGLEVIEQVTKMSLDGLTRIPFLTGQVLSDPVQIIRAVRLSEDSSSRSL